MIERGANDFNHALQYACEYGHIDIAELIIEKGMNDYISGYRLNLDSALLSAHENGHEEIVELLRSHGANTYYDIFTNTFFK